MKARIARIDDLGALVTLRCAMWPHIASTEHERALRRCFESSARFASMVLVNNDGLLCGFIELMRGIGSPDELRRVSLQAVFVAPPMRRCGGATQLLEAAQRWAHGRGATSLYCDLPLDDEQARGMLRLLGFAENECWVRATRPLSVALEVARPGEQLQVAQANAAQRDWQPLPQSASAQADEPSLVVIEKVRSPFGLIINMVLVVAAVMAFANTNIYSNDMVHGMLMPLLDVAFVLYFLLLFAALRYRKRADSSARADQLFRIDD